MQIYPYGPVEQVMEEQELPLPSNQNGHKVFFWIAGTLILIGSVAILYKQWELRNEAIRVKNQG